jgi:hypothetical protein
MIDQPVQHVRGDRDRRWLVDDHFDLIVWYDSRGGIHGFQLCYDKPHSERAFTWLTDRGFSNMQVDAGEAHAFGNQTPILLPDGSFPAERVAAEFERHAGTLPPELRDLVLQKIAEYAQRKA